MNNDQATKQSEKTGSVGRRGLAGLLCLPGPKGERRHKVLALFLFFTAIATITIYLEIEYREQRQARVERIAHLRSDLEARAKELAATSPGSQAALALRELIDLAFKMRVTLSTQNAVGLSQDDDRWFTEWKGAFVSEAHRSGNARIKSALEEAAARAESILDQKQPLFRHRPYVRIWYVAAVVYFLLVLGLYRLGLPPSLGEPVFNVFDVGFIGTIVQYTGGANSVARVLFVISIAVAVLQYNLFAAARKRNSRNPRPILVTLPYIFALVSSYFWACSDEFLFPGATIWRLYVIPLLVASAAAVVAYILVQFAAEQRLIEGGSE